MITADSAQSTVRSGEGREAFAGFTAVRVDGPVTMATAWKLVARVADALERGEPRLLLDLDAVTALDATGVAALLEARRLAERQPGCTLALRANRLVSGALKESGTVAAFTLSSRPGM